MLTFLHLRYQISICTIQFSAHHFLFPYTRCLPCTAHTCGPAVDEQSKGCSWFPWPFLPALLYLEQDFKYTQASHSYFPAVRAAALLWLSVGLSPLTWAKQTSIWEIPPAPTAQKFRQKLFTGSAGTAAQQWLPTKPSGKILAGWAPCTTNYKNRKRQQEKDFHLSHFGITSAAVSTLPMAFTFQAAETQKEA